MECSPSNSKDPCNFVSCIFLSAKPRLLGIFLLKRALSSTIRLALELDGVTPLTNTGLYTNIYVNVRFAWATGLPIVANALRSAEHKAIESECGPIKPCLNFN